MIRKPLLGPTLAGRTKSEPTRASLPRRSLQLAGVAVLLVIAGCDSGDPTQLAERARQFEQQGKFGAALIEAKNAAAAAPNDPQVRLLLGQIHLQMGDGNSALKEFERAVEVGVPAGELATDVARAALLGGRYRDLVDSELPNFPQPDSGEWESLPLTVRADLLAIRGDAAMRLGNRERALSLLEAALDLQPENANAAKGMAKYFIAIRKYPDARALMDRVVASYPEDGEAWSVVALLARAEGKSDDAEKALDKAIKFKHLNLDDVAARALVRLDRNDIKGANEDLAQLKQGAGGRLMTSFVEGAVQLRQENYTNAESAFRAVLAKRPEHGPSQYMLALVMALQGRIEQAHELATRAARASPSLRGAAMLRAQLDVARGDFDAARENISALAQTEAMDAQTETLLGLANVGAGRADEGIEQLRNVAAADGSPESSATLGLALLQSGHDKEAIAAFEAALAADPSLSAAASGLLLSKFRAGDLDGVLTAAKSLLQKQPDNGTLHNAIGIVHARKGDLNAARASFEKALEIEPTHLGALRNLARVLYRQGEVEQIRARYREPMERGPANASLILDLAELNLAEGNTMEAVAGWNKAIEVAPADMRPRLLLSRYWRHNMQVEKALDVMSPIQGQRSSEWEVAAELGLIHLALGNNKEAVEAFDAWTRLDPQSAEARYQLALAESARGNFDKAQQHLTDALELNENHLKSQIALIKYLAVTNRKEADRRLQNLLQQKPDESEVQSLAGWIASGDGRNDEAQAHYQKSFAKMPSRAHLIELVAAQLRAENSDAALQTMKSWLNEHPSDGVVRLLMADTNTMAGKPEIARKEYEAILKEAPDNPIALNNLAALLAESEPDLALQYAQRAREKAPDSPDVMDTLAMLSLRFGRNSDAVDFANRAVSLSGKRPEFILRLATARVANGERELARKAFEQVIAAAPGSDLAEEARQAAAKLN